VFCEGGRLAEEKHASELESIPEDPEITIYWPRMFAQTNGDTAHTKAVMCRTKTMKYVRRLYESDELYDLEKDPKELNNVIDDPAYAVKLAELKERLLSFYLETADVVPHKVDARIG